METKEEIEKIRHIMTASELISQLQILIDACGDAEVHLSAYPSKIDVVEHVRLASMDHAIIRIR